MSTTSPNFALVLATSSDVVAVDSHLANNFSTLDSVLGISHTGSGQLKGGLIISTPVLQSPTVSGTMTGAGIIIATTGKFNTITATGGALTVNSFSVGTYGYPTTAGVNSTILTIVTSNAVWAVSAPNTGANQALSNLAAVALNTSIGTGTAGFFTIDRIIATSGALTGLTTFSASTGTFSSNVTISGTATINAVNCTGGSITAGGITIGTYALPSTIGAAGQVIRATTGNATWYSPKMASNAAFFVNNVSGNNLFNATYTIPFQTTILDLGSNITTGLFTAPASGLYEFTYNVIFSGTAVGAGVFSSGIIISTTTYALYIASSGAIGIVAASFITTVSSGATVGVFGDKSSGSSMVVSSTSTNNVVPFFMGKRLFEF